MRDALTYDHAPRKEPRPDATILKQTLRTGGRSMNPRFMASDGSGKIGSLKKQVRGAIFAAKKLAVLFNPRCIDDGLWIGCAVPGLECG